MVRNGEQKRKYCIQIKIIFKIIIFIFKKFYIL